MRVKSLLVIMLCILSLAACSKGGKAKGTDANVAGTVTGLILPSEMSVVSAQGSGGVTTFGVPGVPRSVVRTVVSSPGFGASADYFKDPSNTYVYDPATDSLQTVNMILCLMAQTGATEMVNKGDYIALVDEQKCDKGSNQSSAGTNGSGAKQYKKWIVNATRASTTAPQLVKIWVPGDSNSSNPEDAGSTLVEVTATAGVSASLPFGSFALRFKGVVDGDKVDPSLIGTQVTTMSGSLRTTGPTQFEFYNDDGGPLLGRVSHGRAVVNLTDAGGLSGSGKTYRSEQNGNNTPDDNTYVFDFNAANFMRRAITTGSSASDVTACLSRTQFDNQVWRYNLYDASSGARIVRNAGFPFQYGGVNGYVGYYGLWAENNAVIPDGATINKVNFSTGATTPYTVRYGDGKLIKRSASTLPVSELIGQTLYYWGQNPNTSSWGQWGVAVSAPSTFTITDSVTFGPTGPVATPVSPVVITPTSGNSLFLWADSLGGNVVYVGGASTITFYNEESVYPNDTLPGTLHCYDRCLKGGLTDAAVGVEPDLYYSYGSGDHPYSVTVSGGKVIVTDLANNLPVNAVGLTAPKLLAVNHEWGIQSGEMAAAVLNSPAEMYDPAVVAVSYRWETGLSARNKLVTLQNGSSYAVFDKPLQFAYTLAAGDERNGDPANLAGKTFRMEYAGAGELHGFPWTQVANSNRWSASVTLKDGVLLGASHQYLVRAMEGEQHMKLANPSNANDLSACTGAGLNTTSLVSSIQLPTAAYGNDVSITAAGKPVVTAAPAVIEGVLQ